MSIEEIKDYLMESNSNQQHLQETQIQYPKIKKAK